MPTARKKREWNSSLSTDGRLSWSACAGGRRGRRGGIGGSWNGCSRTVGKPIEQLGREDVEKHLRRLHVAGRGESVRQGVVVAVRSLGEWCLAHGIVEVNPGASLSGPRPYRREIKVLTVGEVTRLLWGDKRGDASSRSLGDAGPGAAGGRLRGGASCVGDRSAGSGRGCLAGGDSDVQHSGAAREGARARTCGCRWTGRCRGCSGCG